jgi:hypothetical protein
MILKLAVGKPVGRDAVDDPEDIAELVVEPGAHHTGRQRVTHVADALADVVPNVGNLPSRGLPFEVDAKPSDSATARVGQCNNIRGDPK